VAIAMALALDPRVVIMDEPTTALDVVVQRGILDEVQRLRAELGFAVVFITHDLSLLMEISDRIAVMYAGRIVEKAPTPVLFSDMKMRYTQALFRSIPRVTDIAHKRLQTIGGRPPDLVSPPPGCSFAPRCIYARDRCRVETPPLVEANPGHSYACWYPVEAGELEAPAPPAVGGLAR